MYSFKGTATMTSTLRNASCITTLAVLELKISSDATVLLALLEATVVRPVRVRTVADVPPDITIATEGSTRLRKTWRSRNRKIITGKRRLSTKMTLFLENKTKMEATFASVHLATMVSPDRFTLKQNLIVEVTSLFPYHSNRSGLRVQI